MFGEGSDFLEGMCSEEDHWPTVPFELPNSWITGDAQTDTQLNALWVVMNRVLDARIMTRLIETLFEGAD
jgi:hypothetical protein